MAGSNAERWLDTLHRMEAGEFDLLDDLGAETLMLNGSPMARGDLKQLVIASYGAMEGPATTIDEVIERGDTLAARGMFSGSFRNDYRDPHLGVVSGSAGRPFNVSLVAIRKFEDGRLVELWDYMDTYALLVQLGAFGGQPKD